MKQFTLIIFFLVLAIPSYSQMIMSAEGVNPDNACNPSNIYFLMERRARPIESIDSIELKLNEIISFAKDNPDFEGNCAIQFVVNCNGQVGGGFHIVTKSGNDKLDSDLLEFLKTIEKWKAGKKNKKKTVDSWYMWRMEIKNGLIDIQNK